MQHYRGRKDHWLLCGCITNVQRKLSLQKSFFLVLLFVLTVWQVAAQKESNTIIVTSPEGYPAIPGSIKFDPQVIQQLVRRSELHKYSDGDSAQIILHEALRQSIAMGYMDGIGRTLLDLGLISMERGRYNETHIYFAQAATYCRNAIKDKSLLGAYYHYNGILSFYEGAYANAVLYYYKALQESMNRNLPKCPTAYIYSNIAAVFLRLEQNNQALYYLNTGENIARKNGCIAALAYVYNNKGNWYMANNSLDTASIYYQRSLSLASKTHDLPALQAATANLGDIFIKQRKLHEAIAYLQRAMAISNNTNPYYSSIQPLYLMGYSYYLLKDYERAKEMLHAAITKAENLSINEDIANAYHMLSKVYEASGDYKQALALHEKYTVLKDSMLNSDKTSAINQLEVKYRTADKDRTLKSHELLITQQERSLERRNILIATAIAGLLILSIILLGVYRYYRQKQTLQSEQLRSLQQEQKIQILQAMMDGEEKERSRIGRELHDGVGGLLSAMKMNFSVIQNEHLDIGKKEHFTRVIHLLDETASEVRKTAHNLMPEMLYRHGLVEALSIFCEVSQGKGMQIYFQAYGDFKDLSDDMNLSVYRTIQELVQNIVKHSQATEALVQLMRHDHILSISVEDNGVGFDTAATSKGIGIQNMNNRIKAMDGQFAMVSGLGSGTKVYIEFDLQQFTL